MCVFAFVGNGNRCSAAFQFFDSFLRFWPANDEEIGLSNASVSGEEISTIYSEFCFDHFHRPRGGTRNGRLVAFRMLVAYTKKDGLLLLETGCSRTTIQLV